jgi:REP element-mobilizing transposase RayT
VGKWPCSQLQTAHRISAAIAKLLARGDPRWMPPRRRTPAHPEPRGLKSVIVFVTLCTAKRKPILANPAAVATLQRAWRDADGWAVGRYVIMPDHLHLFCAPARDEVTLKQWLRHWRSLASRRWPYPEEQPIWQPDLWDTQLRQGDDYEAKWEYVRNNPVRHGYVETADAWPFAGEIAVLEWEGD